MTRSLFRPLLMVGLVSSALGLAAPAWLAPAARAATPNAQDVLELSLDDSVALAHQRSFRAARSRRNYQISELRQGIARADRLPRADMGANLEQSARGYRYESDRFDYSQPVRGEFRGGVGAAVSMPLDLFGVIGRRIGQADLARQISGQDVALSGLDVTLEAQHAYFGALRAQTALEADERVVAQLEALLEGSRARNPAALPFVELELANARQALTTARAAADQAADVLKQVLRIPLPTRLRLTTSVPFRLAPIDRDELLERALGARPDVQQASLRLQQAELHSRQVTDHRKPSLSLGGFYSQQVLAGSIIGSHRDRFTSHGVGLVANIPLAHWDNGQLSRSRQIARLQQEQVAADADELRERVAFELRQALLALERAESRIRTLPDRQQAFQALQRAEEAMLHSANGQGQALLAQVSNARNVWRSAETASADAYIDYHLALFRLKRVVGETHVVEEGGERPIVALIGSASAKQPAAPR